MLSQHLLLQCPGVLPVPRRQKGALKECCTLAIISASAPHHSRRLAVDLRIEERGPSVEAPLCEASVSIVGYASDFAVVGL